MRKIESIESLGFFIRLPLRLCYQFQKGHFSFVVCIIVQAGTDTKVSCVRFHLLLEECFGLREKWSLQYHWNKWWQNWTSPLSQLGLESVGWRQTCNHWKRKWYEWEQQRGNERKDSKVRWSRKFWSRPINNSTVVIHIQCTMTLRWGKSFWIHEWMVHYTAAHYSAHFYKY